jgi:hypothetical protein
MKTTLIIAAMLLISGCATSGEAARNFEVLQIILSAVPK